jgi:hypothetical protein
MCFFSSTFTSIALTVAGAFNVPASETGQTR